MSKRSAVTAVFLGFSLFLVSALISFAQQTLGGITGQIVDTSGGALPGTTVNLVGDQTKLTRSVTADATGVYSFVNLPIGNYTLTFTHDGFQTQNVPSIGVQANRTATVNAELKVGEVSQTITVEETPLMNAVDTTNGYVLDESQVDSIPLPTGSFTGIAILSPGVNAELSSGTGANNGLGNAPVWANGQRDTSNTFLMNGVDASNIFNGKSTSSVASARVVNNTGVAGAGSTSAEVIQSTASPYLAIGQALPTPAPETIQEVRVNTSMYDAEQGSTSGAHIDVSTASGTNDIHGQLYGHRGTSWLNAAPYFYKQDPNIPENEKVPELHRYDAGGTVGFPIIKNKLFGFLAYQHEHTSDLEIGTSRTAVPIGLTNDRSAAAIAAVSNANFGTALNGTVGNGANQIDPVAFALMNAKLKDGEYVFPSAGATVGTGVSTNFPEDVFLTQPAYFIADQAVADLDYNATAKDTLSLKYYYQHDPTTAPFGFSAVKGFAQHLDAGSQVATITNTQTLSPSISINEVFGFLREKIYSTVDQPFSPASLGPGINTFGSSSFPGITIVDDFGNPSEDFSTPNNPNSVFGAGLSIGSTAASQGAFTGIFQNRWMPSVTTTMIHGKHTLAFGGTFALTQLNARDNRTNKGMIGFDNFANFLQGQPTSYSANGFIATTFLQGDANRYYRAKDVGLFAQDKFQISPNLSLSVGLRLDDHGGLTEKDGKLYNFDPSLYAYNPTSDVISATGLIVAGNNPTFPTKGVSNSTLTGRQWGLAPRIGIAWSPRMFNSKVVVRSGWGLYYDRGELFTYLSPGFASGVIAGGPFGVNQSPPWVSPQQCSPYGYTTCPGGFENPWGTSLGPAPTGNPADLALPNAADIETGIPLFSFAVYNRKNKLPYTLNETLDVQWQPRNDLAIDIGYVGNLGRHEIVPIPFNQSRIAAPGTALCGPAAVCANPGTAVAPQYHTYGYSILADADSNPEAILFDPAALPAGAPDAGSPYLQTFEGGNVDLRVPYIGYSAESEAYTAAGISAYNALQTHIEKRMSHGIQIGFSYTYSHATDEQSGLGLFYNGNNPSNLRSGYGLADFDRTHVMNFNYQFRLHDYFSQSSFAGKLADGWTVEGITVIQSGQPYSIVDYSGAVGSIYFGVNDGITNPIVPLAPGCTPKKALTGKSGATPGTLALDANCFTLPLLSAGSAIDGHAGAVPSNDPYETTFISSGQRNIFRQPWQRRADISIVKNTKINERMAVKYSLDVFNVTNTASFDIPIDNVSQNINYNGFPVQGTPATGPGGACDTTFSALYVCPSFSGLGVTNKTISSPRQIQMSLAFSF